MTRRADMPPLAELLGPNGPLSRALAGYEERPGQTAMAELVEKALKEDRVVLCEAGTGTGKTLAYLLPALLSGRKVIVSTATRALQDQIFFKDLPLVARAFGLEPRVALLKGIGNYLCRRRHAEFRASPESLRPMHAKSLEAVEKWQGVSDTGDLSELAGLSEQDPVRLEVASSSDTRIGASCPHFEECFVTRAKREASAAELVVVNHHLFFADLALRGPHPARVLPDYDAVVFDEAHQLEDVATQFFSVRVSSFRVERLLSDVERSLRAAGLSDPLFAGADGRLVERTRADAVAFFAELARRARGETGRVALDRDVWVGNLEHAYHALDSALESTGSLVERSSGRISQGGRPPAKGVFESLLVAERRVGQLREQLATIVDAGRDRVVWLESQARRVVLSSSPVDLSTLLRERVFETVPAVVLTSATLATSSFERRPKARAPEPPAFEGVPFEGVPFEGMPFEGMPFEGMPFEGMPSEGMPSEGMPSEGMPSEGMPSEGMPFEGMPSEGMPFEGMPFEGMRLERSSSRPHSVVPIGSSGRRRPAAHEPVGASDLPRPVVSGKQKSAFSYLRARLGLSDDKPVEELVLSSPFDFARQALLYTPLDLPPPGTPEFWDAAAARVVELVGITGGGCFVLTTSIRAMKELHARAAVALSERVVLLQGEAPKNSLIGRFRSAGDAVLFATLGFWEGVDVPGRALRLVILEKIPFSVPTDPIVSARARALEEQGGNPFLELHVPAAALTLKQGFGRLVRSDRDGGIVALLDDRIHRKSYGRKLLSALPPAQRTTEIAEVRRFFDALERTSKPSE